LACQDEPTIDLAIHPGFSAVGKALTACCPINPHCMLHFLQDRDAGSFKVSVFKMMLQRYQQFLI